MEKDISSFSFTRIPDIFFGPGSIQQLEKLINTDIDNILVVTGTNSYDRTGIGEKIEKIIPAKKFNRYSISGEPSPQVIDEAITLFKNKNIAQVIAIGGGSVIDAGKAIAAMFLEDGSVKDYLEGIGTRSPSGRRLPFIAVPTTSGTGSEATKNAVISEQGPQGFKKSLRHDNYVPDFAIVDSELTIGCPEIITSSSGMDAFTQLLESYLSVKSTVLTDALAFSGLERIARSLFKVVKNGNNIAARADMAYAALMSGITLTNAGLGLVHGFAQPLGSLYPIPHGVVCCTMMAVVNRQTVQRMRVLNKESETLIKFSNVGRLFTGSGSKDDDYYTDYLIDTIENYTNNFKIPRLSEYGVIHDDLPKIADLTELKSHPVSFDKNELVSFLNERL